jgi:hypothetical protein
MNLVNDPIVSDPEAIAIFESGHFFNSHAPGIFREFAESLV